MAIPKQERYFQKAEPIPHNDRPMVRSEFAKIIRNPHENFEESDEIPNPYPADKTFEGQIIQGGFTEKPRTMIVEITEGKEQPRENVSHCHIQNGNLIFHDQITDEKELPAGITSVKVATMVTIDGRPMLAQFYQSDPETLILRDFAKDA